jgi:hypothetical protein
MLQRYYLIPPPIDIEGQPHDLHHKLVPKDLIPSLAIASLPSSPRESRGSLSTPGLLSGSVCFQKSTRVSSDNFFAEAVTQRFPLISTLDTVRISTLRSAPLARPRLSERQDTSRRDPIRRHLFFLLKASSITLLFLLLDFPIVQFLAAGNGTYQIVNLAVMIILYSNIISATVLQHYRITLDLLQTTIHLKAIRKKGEAGLIVPSHKSEDLKTIQDTTAYLRALKNVSSSPRGQS